VKEMPGDVSAVRDDEIVARVGDASLADFAPPNG